jgi:glycerol-3-phosphate dehydrogenase
MAEDALNHAALIGELPERKCVTETLQLHGWTSPHAPARDEAVAVYGSDARHIARLIEQDPNLAEPLAAGLPYQLAHVAWAARHELARSVEDVLARRTRVLFLDAQAAMDAAPAAATVLAKELGRPPEWAAAQVTEFRKLAAGYLLPG